MDDGALSLLMMLDKEFQRSHKMLLITDFSHLDLLYALIHEAPAFLQFPDLEDAVLHLEKTVLFANGYRPRQEPVSLTDQQLLRGLSTAELSELSRYLKHVKFNEGETIIQKGSSAENIYFLESGQVAIQDSNGGHKDFTLALINAGNCFGEMALLDKQKRSANVRAQTDISCFVMVFEILDKVECLAPIRVKILTNLGATLSSRLRAANKEIASFT
jgi:hypothetical protein